MLCLQFTIQFTRKRYVYVTKDAAESYIAGITHTSPRTHLLVFQGRSFFVDLLKFKQLFSTTVFTTVTLFYFKTPRGSFTVVITHVAPISDVNRFC